MKICIHEHHQPPQKVRLVVSRVKSSVGTIEYSVWFLRKDSQDEQLLVENREFTQEQMSHEPLEVFMETGDKLIAEVPDSYLLFSVDWIG